MKISDSIDEARQTTLAKADLCAGDRGDRCCQRKGDSADILTMI